MEPKLHPALTVSNIKTHVPIILEKDSTHYTTWKTLFKVHCQIYEVLDHLAAKPDVASSSTTTDSADSAKDKGAAAIAETLWKQLDAVVLQWIYATISTPLLHTILQPGQTAHEAWLAVESEFNDNKNTRTIFLGQEFANLCLENFSSMAEYCQYAKHIWLTNIKVLALRLMTGC
ncbi:uncharacterized protein LOC110888943 [Helianthus annuus]|uniref:uncharacterized protein LOC110888943 n=1 Tax=Helianthus annuus TaxID=4232 RepID=UPI000B9075AB|nr:uncharacterized protein LOC110888943 [Helianthus annuus]